jgi:tetratricopeptide (TPR) repeat protein
MIYEWYRGSDTSKAVPRRLNDLRQHEEAMSYKEKIKVLRELLEVEKEPNSRGYLLWRIGREYADEHCQEEAIAAFLEARNAFDPLLGTIIEVMPAYCDTLEFLICLHYYDLGEMETIAELSLAIIANIEDANFDDFTKKMTFFYQGLAFSALARKHDLRWLQPLALASYLKWHHIAPEDEAGLEHLAYAYFRAGDMAHSRSAVEMCLEVAPAGEVRDRIEAFAREHARELDPLSGTS